MVLDFISKIKIFNQIKFPHELSILHKTNFLNYTPFAHYRNSTSVKFLTNILFRKELKTTLNSPQITKSTPFHNKYFFSLQNQFTSKSWNIVGGGLSQFKYNVSYSNDWKLNFFTEAHLSTNIIKTYTKFKTKISNPKLKVPQKKLHNFSNFNTLKLTYKHTNSRQKRFEVKNLSTKKQLKPVRLKKITNRPPKFVKTKVRLRLRLLKKRIKNFIHTHDMRKTKSKSPKTTKKTRAPFTNLSKKKIKRLFHFFRLKSKKTFVLKLYNNFPMLTCQFIISLGLVRDFERNRFINSKSLGSVILKKRFAKVKNQTLSKSNRRWYPRHLTHLNSKLKKLKMYKSKYLTTLINLNRQSHGLKEVKKISLVTNTINNTKNRNGWKHAKPYNFLNLQKGSTTNSLVLMDSYLSTRLQPFTTYKVRNKRAQFFPKMLRKNNIRGKLKTAPFIQYRVSPKIPTTWNSVSFLKKFLSTQSNKPVITSKYALTKALNQPSPLLAVPQKKLFPIAVSHPKPLNMPLIDTKRIPSTSGWYSHKVLTLPKSATSCKKVSIKLVLPQQQTIKVRAKSSTKIKLFTKTNQSFSLKSPVVFFLKFMTNNKIISQIPKFIFKKNIFSFLKPNEARQSLMNRKKQFYFYKVLFNQNVLYRTGNTRNPSKLKQLYLETLKKRSLTLSSTFNNNPVDKLTFDIKNQVSSIINSDIFELKDIDQPFKRDEVRVPRIRFKPGYQRMWRDSRTALKESLNLKFTYQKKLSRYIVKFFKKINYYAFSASEMSISKVLIYSRLVPDVATLKIFNDHRFIYCNGRSVSGLNNVVYENDLMQLIVSKWYYIAYRWISNWTLKRDKRYKRLIYRKGLSSKYKLMKQRKQKSFYAPQWIYLTKYDTADVKPYLEVDYLTLSAVVIYNPYTLTYHTPTEAHSYRPTIYRSYNWKYIT